MDTLQSLADTYFNKVRPVGLVISLDTVVAQAIKAAKIYEGSGEFRSFERGTEITAESQLEADEWAMLYPLFELYVEKENALILEAGRSLGIEPYGRSVSEISPDILQKEQELRSLAFAYDIVTV